jgi:ethanolamine utilization microcompartment shell protein EutL
VNEIEWLMHELGRTIDDAMHRAELEIVYGKNNPDAHYHRTAAYVCTKAECAGPDPIRLLKANLEASLKRLNNTYSHSPLNDID